MQTTDSLLLTIFAAFNNDARLGRYSGPWVDGWQEGRPTEFISVRQLRTGNYSRFLGRGSGTTPNTAYIDRTGLMFNIFSETLEQADAAATAMADMFDAMSLSRPVLVTPPGYGAANDGKILSVQRIGSVTVGHYVGSQRGEDNGILTDSWVANGTWTFIMHRTLGNNQPTLTAPIIIPV